MKSLTFKNRKTGETQVIYCTDTESNIQVAREFRETHGKHWGLLESTQTIRRETP